MTQLSFTQQVVSGHTSTNKKFTEVENYIIANDGYFTMTLGGFLSTLFNEKRISYDEYKRIQKLVPENRNSICVKLFNENSDLFY